MSMSNLKLKTCAVVCLAAAAGLALAWFFYPVHEPSLLYTIPD